MSEDEQQQYNKIEDDKQTRKRDRETSLEPKADIVRLYLITHVYLSNPRQKSQDSATKRGRTANDEKVNQIRDKVEDISWHNKETDKKSDNEEPPKVVETTAPKKQSSFAAFASTASPFASAPSNASNSLSNKPTVSSSNAFSAFAGSTPKPQVESSDISSFNDKLASTQGESINSDNKLDLKPAQITTGEENEENLLQIRSKLYLLQDEPGTSNGNWKERGVGLFKLNKDKSGRSRLVMRADGVLRVILNAALFAKMPVEHPQEKFVRFSAHNESNKLEHYTVKFSNGKLAKEAYETILANLPASKEETSKESEKSDEKEDSDEKDKEDTKDTKEESKDNTEEDAGSQDKEDNDNNKNHEDADEKV
ncbi:PH domain-like protein [Wallemia mellicola]|uniref:PH domain-like protein n=1 Tax=Wallemia mellicola TaxID=1708541 RepID=A0A4T0R3L8_9BASI|nr:PH domain-like protein [Wallemia mellicola]